MVSVCEGKKGQGQSPTLSLRRTRFGCFKNQRGARLSKKESELQRPRSRKSVDGFSRETGLRTREQEQSGNKSTTSKCFFFFPLCSCRRRDEVIKKKDPSNPPRFRKTSTSSFVSIPIPGREAVSRTHAGAKKKKKRGVDGRVRASRMGRAKHRKGRKKRKVFFPSLFSLSPFSSLSPFLATAFRAPCRVCLFSVFRSGAGTDRQNAVTERKRKTREQKAPGEAPPWGRFQQRKEEEERKKNLTSPSDDGRR